MASVCSAHIAHDPNCRTCRTDLDIVKPIYRDVFKEQMQRVYQEFLARQEPLGAEFDKVWMDNLEELYEE